MEGVGLTCPICGSELIEDAVYCPYCRHKLEGAEECEDYAYEAFISYRHLPNDLKVALAVQHTLESFPLPGPFQASAGKKRLGKCFRDEDELPTSSSLTDQIRDALKKSRFLIVVCSPQTRESLWVQRELVLFASYHGRDKILVAIASGESSESFPELLLTHLEQRPNGMVVRAKAEPIAADLRNAKGHMFFTSGLKLTPETLQVINNTCPTGGVISPISSSLTTTTPNQIRFIP